MEGTEVKLLNGMIYGVSCKVESQSSDALKGSSSVFSWRVVHKYKNIYSGLDSFNVDWTFQL